LSASISGDIVSDTICKPPFLKTTFYATSVAVPRWRCRGASVLTRPIC
jgi:hypothetical protein